MLNYNCRFNFVAMLPAGAAAPGARDFAFAQQLFVAETGWMNHGPNNLDKKIDDKTVQVDYFLRISVSLRGKLLAS